MIFVIALGWTYLARMIDRPMPDSTGWKVVEGTVVSLVNQSSQGRVSFYFRPDDCDADFLVSGFTQQVFRSSERWRLALYPQSRQAPLNEGQFDWETWSQSRSVMAMAFMDSWFVPQKMADANPWTLIYWRAAFKAWVESSDLTQRDQALVLALSLGDRSGLTDENWDVFIQTGTNHLLAISGLHIGLIALLSFGFFKTLWAQSTHLSLRWPAGQFGLLMAMVMAGLYAALAGWSYPTQRAWLMVVVLSTFWLSRRFFPPVYGFFLAFFLIVLTQPLALLSPGFWLSFAAVGVLFWIAIAPTNSQSLLSRLFKTHMAMSFLLFPLVALFFNQVSLISPLANLLAVPWISFVVVPLMLVWFVVRAIWGTLDGLDALVYWGFELVYRYLAILSDLQGAWVGVISLPAWGWVGLFLVLMLLWRWRVSAALIGIVVFLLGLISAPLLIKKPQVLMLDENAHLTLIWKQGNEVWVRSTRRSSELRDEIRQTIYAQGWGPLAIQVRPLKTCDGLLETPIGTARLIQAQVGHRETKLCGLLWEDSARVEVFWGARTSYREALQSWMFEQAHEVVPTFLTGCSGMLIFSKSQSDKIHIQHWRLEHLKAWHTRCKNYSVSSFIGMEKAY